MYVYLCENLNSPLPTCKNFYIWGYYSGEPYIFAVGKTVTSQILTDHFKIICYKKTIGLYRSSSSTIDCA